MTNIRPSPSSRFACLVIASVAILMAAGVVTLLSTLCILLCVNVASQHVKVYLRYLLLIVLPISVLLVIVWGMILNRAPGGSVGGFHESGLHYAVRVSLRLAAIGGVWQLILVSLNLAELVSLLKMTRVSSRGILACSGAISIVPELKLRADQIISSRYSRGFLARGSVISRARQLPFVLRPLLAWTLRSAVQRSDAWRQRQLETRLPQLAYRPIDYSRGASVAIVIAAIALLAWVVIERHVIGM